LIVYGLTEANLINVQSVMGCRKKVFRFFYLDKIVQNMKTKGRVGDLF